jgi:hypothetical protein
MRTSRKGHQVQDMPTLLIGLHHDCHPVLTSPVKCFGWFPRLGIKGGSLQTAYTKLNKESGNLLKAIIIKSQYKLFAGRLTPNFRHNKLTLMTREQYEGREKIPRTIWATWNLHRIVSGLEYTPETAADFLPVRVDQRNFAHFWTVQ